MAYVEWHGTLPNHFKTRHLMKELGPQDPNRHRKALALGYLGLLVAWAIENRPGGRFKRALIEVGAEWEGEAGVLAKAMIEAGWVDDLGGGEVKIHDWEEVTRGFRKARKDALRKKRDYHESLRGESKPTRGHRAPTRPDQTRPERGGTAPAAPPIPPLEASPGGRDVVELAKAGHEVDPTIPIEKAEYHVRQALQRGVDAKAALEAIRARAGAEKLWKVLDSLPPPRPGAERPKEPYRGPTVDPRPAGDLKATRDAAREAVDRKLVEMQPDVRLLWREDAKAEGVAAGLPADKLEAFILSRMRVRAAKEFGIEGL